MRACSACAFSKSCMVCFILAGSAALCTGTHCIGRARDGLRRTGGGPSMVPLAGHELPAWPATARRCPDVVSSLDVSCVRKVFTSCLRTPNSSLPKQSALISSRTCTPDLCDELPPTVLHSRAIVAACLKLVPPAVACFWLGVVHTLRDVDTGIQCRV